MHPATLHDPANRVRWWIAFALTAVVVAAALVPLISILQTRERNAVAVADELVVRIGERTADLVGAELTTASQSLELLHQLIGSDASAGEIDRALAAEVRAVPQLSGAFVGFPDGDFRFVRRDGDALFLKHVAAGPSRSVSEAPIGADLAPGEAVSQPDDDFDPRSRPWYVAAAVSDAPVWTDPYVFFTSGERGITTAVAVRADDGEVSAVVGVDLSLDQMARFVRDLPIDESAEAYLVGSDAAVIAPSPATPTALTSFVDVSSGAFDAAVLRSALATGHPATFDGERLFAVSLVDPALPSWSVVVRTGEIDFVDDVQRQLRFAVVATVVAALALIAIIPLLIVRLRRPIDELSRRARFDTLTGLPNRSTLFDAGQSIIRRAYKSGDEVTLAVLDIDDFKSINDRFGHAVGDLAIQAVGAALRDGVGPNDLVGRLGGDEFVIVTSGPDRAEAEELLEGLRSAVVARLRGDERFGTAGVTVGAAWLSARALHIQRLIAEADHALIEAKRRAKGTVAAL